MAEMCGIIIGCAWRGCEGGMAGGAVFGEEASLKDRMARYDFLGQHWTTRCPQHC